MLKSLCVTYYVFIYKYLAVNVRLLYSIPIFVVLLFFYLMPDLLVLYICTFTHSFFLFFFSFFISFSLFHYELFFYFSSFIFFVIIICYLDLSQNLILFSYSKHLLKINVKTWNHQIK